ncbi:hypothetical protein AGDE_13225 [Angomonas deanei]|uniref:Enoyl-CoA hydratase/isomerase domain-containing protein n=1 Tax=Angomonas deanei TaxID=59799 RepID=A0A7G2CR34_9TRYP|nr:hypothetical protein AGDE_13225 [Angomonas deanei]CAD2221461.1 hypothetical protein, conserved [Angomonas deanei]|eukprot:EPY22620.1 hypothetical protein AGDE_13225 [Angomonas deanei]
MKKRPGTRITPKLTITVGGSVTPVKTTTTVPPSTTGLSSVPLVSFEVVERAGVITIQHFDQNVLNEKVRRMISFYLKLAQQEKNVHYIVLMAHPAVEVFSVGVDLGELRDNLILMTPSANTIVHTNYSSVGTVEPPCVNTSFTPSASTSLRRSSLTGESGTLSDKVAEGRSPTMEGVKESGTLLSNSSLPAGVPSLTANTFSLNDLCSEIELSRKYVLVALHGAVVGGGLEVALSAHSRLATYDSYFGFPEVKFGFFAVRWWDATSTAAGGGTTGVSALIIWQLDRRGGCRQVGSGGCRGRRRKGRTGA